MIAQCRKALLNNPRRMYTHSPYLYAILIKEIVNRREGNSKRVLAFLFCKYINEFLTLAKLNTNQNTQQMGYRLPDSMIDQCVNYLYLDFQETLDKKLAGEIIGEFIKEYKDKGSIYIE